MTGEFCCTSTACGRRDCPGHLCQLSLDHIIGILRLDIRHGG
jgi:hypothetical protein